MSVNNGNPANADTFNTSFMSREVDTSTVGVVNLDNTTDINSGAEIVNVQRYINEIADSDGTAGEGDATRKTYSSTTVIANNDNRKVAIGKLDAELASVNSDISDINTEITNKFDAVTGHNHDGTAGNGGPISAASLTNFNNYFAEYQEFTFDSASGLSTDVTASFSLKSPGGGASVAGVITTAPDNRVEIVGKDDLREIEDSSGRRVFAKLTESAGTWTLTYFVNIGGVDTAHSLSSQNIRYLYREVFTASTRPTITPSVGKYDSLAAVEDIPDASATQAGKVSTTAQTFAGDKNFTGALTKSGVDVVTISGAQVITNKDIDGGVATNTRRITLPKETTANIAALTRKEGTVFYDTTLQSFYGDNGTSVISLAGSTTLDGLSDVVITAPANDEVLTYDSGTWKNLPLPASSGSGDLDTFYTEEFETNLAASLTSGNNATFDNGGVLNGVLSNETVSPIAGTRSIKYTMGAASTNDWFHTGAITLEEKQKGQFVGFILYASYTGAATDIQAILWDDTNNTTLASLFITASTTTRYSLIGFVPTTCNHLKIGFKVSVGNNTKVLIFDDLELSQNPFKLSGGAAPDSTVTVDTNNGFGSTNTKIRRFTNVTTNFGSDIIYADSATLGASFTVTTDGVYNVSYTDGYASATNFYAGITVNSTELTTNVQSLVTISTRKAISFILNGDMQCNSWEGYLTAGSVIRPHTNGVAGTATNLATMTVSKQGRIAAQIISNSAAANSTIRVKTLNGMGSTNTRIWRWTNIVQNTGSAITLAQSATLGDTFTINETGIYSVSLTSIFVANTLIGVTRNSTQLSTNVNAQTDTSVPLFITYVTAGENDNGSWQGILNQGDVIRVHAFGTTVSTSDENQFTISKIGTTQVTGVPYPLRALVYDQKATGTEGGTSSTSYVTRDLNTVSGDPFVTVSANQFTLPAGRYYIDWEAPGYQVDFYKTKLRNITDSTDLKFGSSGMNNPGSGNNQLNIMSHGHHVFSITSTKVFEIQMRCSLATATSGHGKAAGLGDPEIYTQVTITKVG